LPKCHFTTKYYDYENGKEVDFYCVEESLASGFCIFHDKDYLQDKNNYEEHKRKVLDRLKHKVNHAISNNQTLRCIGFQLHDFSLSDLSINKEFTKYVYFSGSQFFGIADFSGAKFEGRAVFSRAKFQAEVFSIKLISKEKQTLTILNSTAKHTSQGTSKLKQISSMCYLKEKRKLSLT
jgi:hypothetical protein